MSAIYINEDCHVTGLIGYTYMRTYQTEEGKRIHFKANKGGDELVIHLEGEYYKKAIPHDPLFKP